MRLVPAIFAVVTLLALGCGGRTLGPPQGSDGPDGGDPSPDPTRSSEADGGGADDSGTSPFPICPENPPDDGLACDTPNQGCAYVDVRGMTCASWTCDATGRWTTSTPAGCPTGG